MYEAEAREYERRPSRTAFIKLKEMEQSLNAKVSEINSMVPRINSLAKTLNINAAMLEKMGEERGEEFTEGEYKENIAGREINIYEWSSGEKLERLFIHELGHALGLTHVGDPGAIMYYLNQNKNGKLTEADILEFRTTCRIKM